MSENLMVGSHKYTPPNYAANYGKIIKRCRCGKIMQLGEKCGCADEKETKKSSR